MAFPSDRLRNSKSYSTFQSLLRVLQFLSSVLGLGLFSARIAKIIQLTRHASTSNGAVEGILAAAVLYTLVAMISRFCIKSGAPTWVRLALVVFDIAFVIAFIAVSVLTRPHGGSSGPCKATRTQKLQHQILPHQNCTLPWGVFFMAIFSTILHAITAIFHEVKDHRKHTREQNYKQTHEQKLNSDGGDMEHQNGYNGPEGSAQLGGRNY